MVTRQRTALDYLRHALSTSAEGVGADDALLARFLSARDEDAFAALVQRHGGMVWGVCRRLLRDYHDAEDCFQAVFLVLARKAGSVRKRASVASWLYGVALRTAREANRMSTRRRSRERPLEGTPDPCVAPSDPQDWRPVLDQALAALPEQYREVIVLCCLQEQTRRQAARRLGIPEGTLSWRLASAKKMLAHQLARRGVAPAGAAVAVLAAGAAVAQVPPALVRPTAKAAILAMTGQLPAAAAPAAALTKEVLNTMFVTKVKLVVGLLTAAIVIGASGLAFYPGAILAEAPTVPPMVRGQAAPENKDIDRLIQQLGSRAFKEREAATNALKRVGKPALRALREAERESPDAEVRIRAARLIQAIGDSRFCSIDLGSHVNQKLNERFHKYRDGNDLAALPTGKQRFAGIPFTVAGGLVQVGGDKPAKAEGIRVGAKIVKLHFLHACGFCGSIPRGTPVGKYVVHYEDKRTQEIAIVYGRDVVDWWVQPGVADPTGSKVAWTGQNQLSPIRLFLTTWENPNPEKRIVTLDYVATGGNPFCVAISAEE
jgi:RNA polymerase sigma factor (sigma-70 family)